MIKVVISHEELVLEGACDGEGGGMDLFRQIASRQWGVSKRAAPCVIVPRWTQLHSVWLAVAYPAFAEWLIKRGMIPRTYCVNVDLQNVHLGRAYLEHAILSHSELGGTDLQGANLRHGDFRCTSFKGANLTSAKLRRANLYCTRFERAVLKHARLDHALLEYADLERANMEGADLEEADLGGANLGGTNLRFANLRGANLDGVNLTPSTKLGHAYRHTWDPPIPGWRHAPTSVHVKGGSNTVRLMR